MPIFVVIVVSSFLSFIPLYTYSLYTPTVNNNDIWNLTIIHTNDVHSHYDQINEEFTDCTAKQLEENRCFGGIARHKTVIDRLRRENKNSLLLDGGDQCWITNRQETEVGTAPEDLINYSLIRLLLRTGFLGKGLKALTKALCKNNAINSFSIHQLRFNKNGGRMLRGFLRKNTTIRDLNLENNNIGFKGEKALEKALKDACHENIKLTTSIINI
ncbi:hypothetical protein C2G38_1620978 [Gigaspora rosea]|uniref:Metallo-dependent phosphatase-like protein n=1 Tax=Gigaspora rosea TaxID=44941 RepID=A0A397UYP2_9GLOM|nr:hypothetical protein C2G38_1620978 [Gigaspora rosea]